MLHVGVDLHKRRAQVAVVDDEGRLRTNCALACDRDLMRDFFARLGEPAHVGVEATSNWYWFCDLLEEMELPVQLSHPGKTKAIASARIKNDKVDALTLAQLLRADLLPAAHISTPQVRLHRELLRHRAMLVRLRTGVKNRVHALLARYNLVFADAGLFTGKGRQWLERLELHPTTRGVLQRMLTLVETLDLLIAEVDPQIQVSAQQDAQARLLTTISGIGYYSALMIVAEIDGIERFPDARHLCSYAGLVPSVRTSADYTRHGHITKQGSPWLRWILVEICQKARSRDDVLGEHYRRVVRPSGKGAAKVATARKLLKAIYFMLRDGSSFEQVSEHMRQARQAGARARG
jgi:transposase